MDSELSFSDAQKAKITPIVEERQEKMKSLTSEGGRRREKAREMKAIMEDSDKKIKALPATIGRRRRRRSTPSSGKKCVQRKHRHVQG